MAPKVCLTLTEKTLAKCVETYRRYHSYIDIVELRADYLTEEEQFRLREFPSMVRVPCILTIRRKRDGGLFEGTEFSRTTLFSHALAFADKDPTHNFAYVDFEEDFNIPSLNDITLAFSIRIIRSCHDFSGPVTNLRDRFIKMQQASGEIFKIAFMPRTLSDVTRLFYEARSVSDIDHIFCAMGPLGVVSRILSRELGSFLTYTSPGDMNDKMRELGHIDPVTLCDMYHFRDINEKTKIFAVTGWPLKVTSSPLLHNTLYKKYNVNAVFVPLPSTSAQESIEFSNVVGVKGLAITVPYKEKILSEIDEIDETTALIGSCNTAVRTGGSNVGIYYNDSSQLPHWSGHNTDALGFSQALEEFIGVEKFKHFRVSLIGAGGAARAVAFALKALGCKVCIFNRTLERARDLSALYGFDYAELSDKSIIKMEKYSDIIVQTTNVGMNSTDPSNKQNDPIWFYNFSGHEKVFDIIYTPEVTPLMKRAQDAGCDTCNGLLMLRYQGYKQFEYFTGVNASQ